LNGTRKFEFYAGVGENDRGSKEKCEREGIAKGNEFYGSCPVKDFNWKKTNIFCLLFLMV
jgi:hypothetical protein